MLLIITEGNYRAAHSLTTSPFIGIPTSAAHIAPNLLCSPVSIWHWSGRAFLVIISLIRAVFEGLLEEINTEKSDLERFVS